MAVAAANTALRPIILRAAQVSGGINGYWKPAEWIPSIILSAHAVKSLPLLEQVTPLALLVAPGSLALRKSI